ncbi:hypothetical protein TWF730_005356 [Orbilia blumenaviensis]|uniref:ribonuclease H n=1 Tax=Orbilia blumenaviensis TaxID=1796055 RepID=A0AAV9VIK0_9PEZI
MDPNSGQFKGIYAPYARNWELEAAEDDPSIIPDIKVFEPNPPDAKPWELFPPGVNFDTFKMPHHRFIHLENKNHILIYTDGACLDNGTETAAGGCAFIFRPQVETDPENESTGIVSFRLEDTGPNDEPGLQTSNRAELRAVIAVLQYRVWYGEGQKKIVIATDSEYVVYGITEWVKKWGQNGWITSGRNPVANRDLWEALLKELRHYGRKGAQVEFWRIQRGWNAIADRAAKAAAGKPRVAQFTRKSGVCV